MNRFLRPGSWLGISLRGAVPAWFVLVLLVLGDSLAFRHALLAGLGAIAVAGLLAWRPAQLAKLPPGPLPRHRRFGGSTLQLCLFAGRMKGDMGIREIGE